MTPLAAKWNTYASRSTRSPAPSSVLRVPHVFVTPPEEEQQENPPWCCFDAGGQPGNDASDPDTPFLDVPYLVQQSEQVVPVPIARYTSVRQPRSRIPISKKLERTQRPEAIKIIESKPSQARQRGSRDSDVIEVVKVKRTRDALMDPEENMNAKRSKTLKARATKALQSIKNVGKSSHRAHVKELWTSSESMPGVFEGVQQQVRSQQDQTEHQLPIPSIKKGSLSRNDLRSLSRVFRSARPPRQEPSFTVCMASVTLAEAHDDASVANPSSLPHLRYNYTNPSLHKVPSTLTLDDALNGPVSRGRHMKKNSKFSVRELHRLFSASSSSPDDPSTAPTATTTPSISTLPSKYPDVPIEQDIHRNPQFSDLGSASRKIVSGNHHTRSGDSSTPRHLGDLSIEMRLDSLHFDALSFDPEDFDVSMDGNILR